MADFKIVVRKDLSSRILQALKSERVPAALEAIGFECETYAQKDSPVDTGRLRSSITHKVINSEKSVYVGTNVEYAVYQEYGDYNHTTGKKHFLRDAAANHKDHYLEILKASLNI